METYQQWYGSFYKVKSKGNCYIVDITKLKLGDIFYRAYGYEFMYKIEVVQEYDPERDILAAKYLCC